MAKKSYNMRVDETERSKPGGNEPAIPRSGRQGHRGTRGKRQGASEVQPSTTGKPNPRWITDCSCLQQWQPPSHRNAAKADDLGNCCHLILALNPQGKT
jgi:hypothetical protein